MSYEKVKRFTMYRKAILFQNGRATIGGRPIYLHLGRVAQHEMIKLVLRAPARQRKFVLEVRVHTNLHRRPFFETTVREVEAE